MLRESLRVGRRVNGDMHIETVRALTALGSLLQSAGKPEEAEGYLQEALATSRNTITLNAINSYGRVLQLHGRLEEAEAYFREALSKYRRVMGEDHLFTLISHASTGGLLADRGAYEEAEKLLSPAEEVVRRVAVGPDARFLARYLMNLGKGARRARFCRDRSQPCLKRSAPTSKAAVRRTPTRSAP